MILCQTRRPPRSTERADDGVADARPLASEHVSRPQERLAHVHGVADQRDRQCARHLLGQADDRRRLARAAHDRSERLVDAKALGKTAADLASESPGDRTVCELGDGAAISPETARRILCSAPYSTVLFDEEGRIRGATKRTRAIPVALRRALVARDGCCRFPGCSNRAFMDAHHVQHWISGGETKLDNLVMLCTFHHRLVHEGGFGVRREEEAFVFYDPMGRRIDPVPSMPDPGESALRDRARENRERGSRVDHRSNEPRWDGTRMDHSAAVAIVESAVERVLERGVRPPAS